MKFNTLNKILKFFTFSLLIFLNNFASNQSLELLEQNQKELLHKLTSQADSSKIKYLESKISKINFLKVANNLCSKEQSTAKKTFLEQDSLKNLNIFNNAQDPENTLFDKIDKTHTSIGSLTLAQMIANPQAEMSDVQKNQEIIKALCQNQKLFKELDALLSDFKVAEENFLKIFNQYSNIAAEEILQNLEKDLQIFKKEKNKRCSSFLNALKNRLKQYKNSCVNMWKNKVATLYNVLFFYYPLATAYLYPTSNPTIGYSNPTFWISLLIKLFNSNPMSALVFMYMVGIPINEFFSLGFPFLAGGVALKETRTVLKETFWDNPAKQKLIETKFKEYAQGCAQLLEKIPNIYKAISEEKFFKDLTNSIDANNNNFYIAKHLINIGKLDAYLSLAKLHLQGNFCLVNFTQEPHLNIKFKRLKNPLNPNKTLNAEINEKASEIPSFLQEISTAIILAHLGIAPAEECTLTPLKYMYASSQLNMLTVN